MTKNALQHDRAAAIRTSLGVCCGLLCWTVASAVGIAALLRASAQVFDLLRLAGAVYLVCLGVQAIAGTLRRDGRRSAADIRETTSPEATRPPPAFRQGLMSNLLNPKIGAFFTSFLPQFVAPSNAASVASR